MADYTAEQLRAIDRLVAEHITKRAPKVTTHVSNDGGKSTAFGNDDWSTEHIDISEWLREKQSRGLMTDYQVVRIARYPAYTSDWEAMGEVIEKMARDVDERGKGHTCNMQWKGAGRWYEHTAEVSFVRFFTTGHAVADTIPLAVCLAALKAVGVAVPVPGGGA